jgi:hypothetical protein
VTTGASNVVLGLSTDFYASLFDGLVDQTFLSPQKINDKNYFEGRNVFID